MSEISFDERSSAWLLRMAKSSYGCDEPSRKVEYADGTRAIEWQLAFSVTVRRAR